MTQHDSSRAQRPFTRTFLVRWADMDFNSHMRNTAYLDMSADTRMLFFQENGFTMREFERLRIGPVVRRDEVEYFRELRLLETVTVSFSLAGLSADASRMRLRNEFVREDGQLAAKVTTTGGWLDLAERRLVSPPAALAEALRGLARAEDFQELTSSVS
jgi:acyl-CoA thioester hydrolase